MIDHSIAENALALGFILVLTAVASPTSQKARSVLAVATAALIARYIIWRWTYTVAPIGILSVSGAWVWFCFAIELLVFSDTWINLALLSRYVDRKTEADDHERRARVADPASLPSIDVLIPTYNEDLNVLERSIVGALAIDYPNKTVWVLDDGQRPWLSDYCAQKGARYLTRSDRRGAKAGNLNAALPHLNGDLLAVLDADFVPRRNFLFRLVGFFEDPSIACVQTPQVFFNKDPIQINLGLGSAWSDDQRFFFDVVMPSRDAWGVAFCCGTGFLLRREALNAIGGFPTASVCEDMLMSLKLMRRGLRTVYLNEELCLGLAPESLEAYFVQRRRWCRGQIQMLYLRDGQLGPGLSLLQRLFFLPTYWGIHLPSRAFLLIVPLVFLWTGLSPFHDVNQWDLLRHFGPALIANIAFVCWIGPRAYFPILSDATNAFLGARIAPTVWKSFVRPFGERFLVTPKGQTVRGGGIDSGSFWFCLSVFLLTLAGLAWNTFTSIPLIEDMNQFPLAAVWSVTNCVIAAYAALIARERPRYRSQERFPLGIAAKAATEGDLLPCTVVDVSLSGAFVRFGNHPVPAVGSEILISSPILGPLRARIMRERGDGAGVRFESLPMAAREQLNRLMVSHMQADSRAMPRAHRQRLNLAGHCVVGSEWGRCEIIDASLTGALITFTDGPPAPEVDTHIIIDFPEVGAIEGVVVRSHGFGVGVSFENVSTETHDRLIQLLYTAPRPIPSDDAPSAATIVRLMGRAAFGPEPIRQNN